MESGANVNSATQHGFTSLQLAARAGELDLCSCVLDCFAFRCVVLHCLLSGCVVLLIFFVCVCVRRLLLGAGADVNAAEPSSEQTALQFAADKYVCFVLSIIWHSATEIA